MLSSNSVSNAFMVWGLIQNPIPRELGDKLQMLGGLLHKVELGHDRYFVFSEPPYIDWVETDDMLGVKVGLARIDNEITSMSALVDKGLVTSNEIDYDKIDGNTLILNLNKREGRLSVYKTLLAVPDMYYTSADSYIICTNNLGLMRELLPDRLDVNPVALPLHFLYRNVPGNQTYFKNVFRLRPGEVLDWRDGTLRINLPRTLHSLQGSNGYEPVNDLTIERFLDQLQAVMDSYLMAMREKGNRSGLLLSGGIDSSLLQLCINRSIYSQKNYSFSYTVEVESFKPENNNAKQASEFFSTEHTFVPGFPKDYPDLLIKIIEVLGQPPHHEKLAFALPFHNYIASQRSDIRYLFNGQGADGILGSSVAEDIHRVQRYSHWPIGALQIIEKLESIWPRQAKNARQVVNLLPYLWDKSSPYCPLNSHAMYSDWEALTRCFTPQLIEEALAYRQGLENVYLASTHLIEKVHMVGLLSGTYNTACLRNQVSLYYGKETVFPYLDSKVLTAAFTIDPNQRFFFNDRVKPIPKQLLDKNNASSLLGKPKFGGGFREDLFKWMKQGRLSDLVRAIERPPFMEKDDFERKVEAPDWFTWNLLTFDLFQKQTGLSI
jgi:asparagine synthetase B (glutamine-hydrolysing)